MGKVRMRATGSHFNGPILFCVLAFLSSGCNETIGKVVSKHGFTELRPPSALLLLGTIITVREASPLTADIVCVQEASLGSDLPLQASETAEREVASHTSTSLKISADWLRKIQANAQYSAVENITLALTNVLIREVSDVTVFDKAKNRSADCVKAIAGRARNGQIVSMVKSIVGADVVYKVDFKSDANLYVSEKESLMKNLALELGADASTATSETVKGKGLIWGVHDDTWLAGVQPEDTFSVFFAKDKKSKEYVRETLARESLLSPDQVLRKIIVNP
jgi:hypothetical protein